MKTVSVRPAIEADLNWILAELKSFSAFFDTQIPLFPNDEFALHGMRMHIENHILLVAESEVGLLGFVAGMFHPHTFNPSIKVLTETFWWVKEEFRGSRAGLVLLNEFTRIGKMHADWLIFTLEDKSPVNDRCLINRGYYQKERCFMLEVDRG